MAWWGWVIAVALPWLIGVVLFVALVRGGTKGGKG